MEEPNWDFNEVIVASNANSVSVIHPKTGKVVKTYNSINNTAPKCLALLGEEYFIGASSNIPDIKMWPVRDEKSSVQINSPCGLVNALTASSCGTYCVAAFKQEIRVWNVQSGEMLAAFTRHYQDVTVLKFTCDDAIFISGSKDGSVQAWILSKVTSINLENPDRVKPLHSWNNHTKEVTDVFVGSLGAYSRIASSSADMTCKIYELDTGFLLTTVCLDVPITSVAMDSLEYYLVLGTQKGTVCKINLYYEQPRELHNNTMEKDEVNAHTNAVISLSMSIAGDKFISLAALDSSFKIWEVASLTCILCVPNVNSPYRNAFFTIYPSPLLTKQEPYFFVKQLDRTFISARERSQRNGSILFKPHDKKLSLIHAGNFDKNYHPKVLFGLSDEILAEAAKEDPKHENAFQEAFRGETMNEIREVNAQMYTFMIDQVFKNIDTSAQAMEEN